MCMTNMPLTEVYRAFQDELVTAGLLVRTGVEGLYGRSGAFEAVVSGIERCIDRISAPLKAEVMRFPPLMSRQVYCRTDHLELFPDLMGSVHSFVGDAKGHSALMKLKLAGEDWTRELAPIELMATPAACYPLYPTLQGVLPTDGRLVDLQSYIFRHEPSPDPARMQMFRQREFVRLGTPAQAMAHREQWLDRGLTMFSQLGLKVDKAVANDPFFGRAAAFMAVAQKEQELKFEIVTPICSDQKPTAISSCNYHVDHFGQVFGIQTPDGAPAHSACVGFGLERITLALLRTHGLQTARWPHEVRTELSLG